MGLTIFYILDWSFFIAAVLIPVLIVVKSIKSYRLVRLNKEIFTFKAVAALCVWLLLTIGLFFLKALLAYMIGHALSQSPSIKPEPSLWYIGLHLIYFSIGYWLVYWVSRQKRIKLP